MGDLCLIAKLKITGILEMESQWGESSRALARFCQHYVCAGLVHINTSWFETHVSQCFDAVTDLHHFTAAELCKPRVKDILTYW